MTRLKKILGIGCVAGVLGAWTIVAPQAVLAADDKPAAAAKPDVPAGWEEVAIKRPKPAFIGTPKQPPPGLIIEPPRKPGEGIPKLFAPPGTKNLALNKPVTSSDKEPIIGKLDQVTDGDKEATDGSWVELGPGLQWVQIDLGKPSDIYGFVVWHHHGDPRVYKDIVVQVADDEDFISNVKTVFNNDNDNSSGLGIGKDMMYYENFEGKLIPVNDAKGRYVRLYSKGNTSDDQNHYTEVEIFGIQK